MGGNLTVTGNTTSTNLSVTGTATLANLSINSLTTSGIVSAAGLTITNGATVGGNLTVTGNTTSTNLSVTGTIEGGTLSTAGNLIASHFIGNGGTPTWTNGTNVTLLSITGTDLGGAFSVTVAGTDADGVIVTITFKRAFTVAPTAIVISPINKATSTLAANQIPFVTDITTTGFVLRGTATIATGNIGYYFIVVQ